MTHMNELDAMIAEVRKNGKRVAAIDRKEVTDLLFLQDLPDYGAAIDYCHGVKLLRLKFPRRESRQRSEAEPVIVNLIVDSLRRTERVDDPARPDSRAGEKVRKMDNAEVPSRARSEAE